MEKRGFRGGKYKERDRDQRIVSAKGCWQPQEGLKGDRVVSLSFPNSGSQPVGAMPLGHILNSLHIRYLHDDF